MRLSNILLVLDADSNCIVALRRAVALARNERASLTVCTVVDSIPPDYRRGIVAVTPIELIDLAVADRFERLQKLIRRENVEDLPITTRVLIGKPHVEIAHQVLTRQFDLVIKSAKPLYKLGSRAFGRTDKRLMRTCPCPLWLVTPANSDGNGPILAALDLNSADPMASDVNRRILRTSTALALAEFREMHIVNAWNAPDDKHMSARRLFSVEANIDDMAASESEQRRNWLRTVVHAQNTNSERAAMHYLAPTLHVIKGDPKRVVPNLAKELDASLLVVGTAARSGIAGFLSGNTSEKILTGLSCSLLIVKPPGLMTGFDTASWHKDQRRRSLSALCNSEPHARAGSAPGWKNLRRA